MEGLILRRARADDFPRIAQLNEVEVRHTSPMDLQQLNRLQSLEGYHLVALAGGEIAGFLLAMREQVAYDSPNYQWFNQRYESFVYVDRIVVAAACKGMKIGTAIYRDLIAFARSRGVPRIVCEYNLDPPNLTSKKFHDAFGFREVGTQRLQQGGKLVSMQALEINLATQ